jgi:integrase
LRRDGERFSNGDEAAHYLVKEKPSYIGGTHEIYADLYRAVSSTAESIRNDRPAAEDDFGKMSDAELAHDSPHLSTRQYARVVDSWVKQIGLDPAAYGTHTLRRTRASLIYRRTKNLRAVQLLLGPTKLESTVRYLGIEMDDALEMAEQTEV